MKLPPRSISAVWKGSTSSLDLSARQQPKSAITNRGNELLVSSPRSKLSVLRSLCATPCLVRCLMPSRSCRRSSEDTCRSGFEFDAKYSLTVLSYLSKIIHNQNLYFIGFKRWGFFITADKTFRVWCGHILWIHVVSNLGMTKNIVRFLASPPLLQGNASG